MSKVYDCCMFYNELNMLETRFHILEDVVDYFVVCEAAETHSGQPKPYYFVDNIDRFVRWADKIILVQVDDLTGVGRNSWDRERYHRSRIADGLNEAQADDWIIVSDVDEIPDPEAVSYLPDLPVEADIIKFELSMFYYDLNHRVAQGWAIGAARHWREQDPNRIRTCANEPWDVYQPAGWHFSYFGGAQQIVEKVDAFMHANDPVFRDLPRDPAFVASRIEAGLDLYARPDMRIVHVPISDGLPRYILDHIDEYKAKGWLE